jgi:hypothetical protein
LIHGEAVEDWKAGKLDADIQEIVLA